MTRHDPLAAGEIPRGTPHNPFATLGNALEPLARAHCLFRNQKVALVIAYCLLLRSRLPRDAGGHFTGARWQIPLDDFESDYTPPPEWAQKIADAPLNDTDRAKLLEKFTRTQDAHHLPCEIQLSGHPLHLFFTRPGLLASPFGESTLLSQTIRSQFGGVDRLPRIFNEADSHAEKLNLKQALLDACLTLLPTSALLGANQLETAHAAAYATWLREADRGFADAITRNRELHDAAPAKSYERLYRELKIAILEHYRSATAAERPDVNGWRLLLRTELAAA